MFCICFNRRLAPFALNGHRAVGERADNEIGSEVGQLLLRRRLGIRIGVARGTIGAENGLTISCLLRTCRELKFSREHDQRQRQDNPSREADTIRFMTPPFGFCRMTAPHILFNSKTVTPITELCLYFLSLNGSPENPHKTHTCSSMLLLIFLLGRYQLRIGGPLGGFGHCPIDRTVSRLQQ